MGDMEAATVLGQAPEGAWTASLTPSKVSSDEQLVAMIRAGHPTAFEIVYDRHSRAILAYCRRLLGDLHEAEDAVQHTFLAAYRALMAGKEDIQLQPWLFTIARNRCYSILRARREVAVADIHEGVSDGPAAVVQRREELRDVVLDVSR